MDMDMRADFFQGEALRHRRHIERRYCLKGKRTTASSIRPKTVTQSLFSYCLFCCGHPLECLLYVHALHLIVVDLIPGVGYILHSAPSTVVRA